jgi:hypothetical protein
MKDEAFEIRNLRMEIKRETACAQQAEDCGNHGNQVENSIDLSQYYR